MDEKTRFFKFGFDTLATQLRERYYTSVSDFSHALSLVISTRMAGGGKDSSTNADIDAVSSHLNEVKPGTAQHMALTQEQKDIKRKAKRILKAVNEPLEDAMRREADLRGREVEEEIKKLDAMGMFASKSLGMVDGDTSVEPSPVKANAKRRSASDVSAAAGASPEDEDVEMADADADRMADEEVIHLNIATKEDTAPILNKKSTPASEGASRASSSHSRRHTRTSSKASKPTEPLSPPISTSPSSSNASASAANNNSTVDPTDVFANGGIPWYLEPFDPTGTTVHEERYTGRAVLRAMSEELSDMDEDTLTELAVNGSLVDEMTPKDTPAKRQVGAIGASAGKNATSKAPKRKGRRQQWTKPRVRERVR